MPFVLSMGLIALWAAPANAASTRAEYIAQADPICQSTLQAERQALGPKGTVFRLLKKGRYKEAARRYRNTIAAFAPGVEQVAAVEPPITDAQVIGSWVQMLRAQIPVAKRATDAMAHGRTQGKRLIKFLELLGLMNVKTRTLVANFGFQYCQNL